MKTFEPGHEFVDVEQRRIQVVVSRDGDNYLTVNKLERDIAHISDEWSQVMLYPYSGDQLRKFYMEVLRMEVECKVDRAMGWLNRMFGGVTQEQGFARQLSIPEIMGTMRRHGLVWDRKAKTWRDPKWEATVKRVREEFGSAAATVLWG